MRRPGRERGKGVACCPTQGPPTPLRLSVAFLREAGGGRPGLEASRVQRPAGGTALVEQAPRHVPRGERTEQRMTDGGGVHLSRACIMLPPLGLLVLAWSPVMLGRVWHYRESGFAANIQQGVY